MSTPTTIEETAAESAPPPKKQTPKAFSELQLKFRAARRVSTPLIATKTPDPAATMMLMEATLVDEPETPIIYWDIATGLKWRNDAGLKAIWYDLLGNDAAEPEPKSDMDLQKLADKLFAQTQAPFNALKLALKAPIRTLFFFANAHRAIPNAPAVSQAICNMRDVYKRNRRTLVMFCPDITLPPELQHDVLVLDEPLPDRAHLAAIVKAGYDWAKLPEPKPEIVDQAVDSLCGLAAYPAESATVMSLTKNGVNLKDLRSRTNAVINSTMGLSVNTGDVTFDGLGGLASIKGFIGRLCSGKRRPRMFLRFEEIEKLFGGAGTDTSGVSQEYLMTLLTTMQDRNWDGLIAVGFPGSGKSEISNAAGNTFGVRTINCDIAAMKGSLVGQSKQQLDQALKIVSSVSNDEVFVIATCNGLTNIPPELKRRFRKGVWMFDLSGAEERIPIWKIYRRKFDIPDYEPTPYDEGWTGAEIKQCCENAWALSCSLEEAAKLIVPVSRSAPELVKQLREQASNRFLSASYPGVYQFGSTKKTEEIAGGRHIGLED